MNFAEALVRIEEKITTIKQFEGTPTEAALVDQLGKLFVKHADSIVQLAKVAERMRSGLYDDERGVYEYDKLMKEGSHD